MNIVSLRVPDHVAYEKLDDEFVLLNSQNATYYRLNRVGSRFWALVTSVENLGDVISTLGAEFDVDEGTLVADLEVLVEDLISQGLLESDDQASAL